MIGPEHSALQHEHAPRPLPLFLELVRELAVREPEIARDALKGLSIYAHALRQPPAAKRAVVARARGATLRDHGGTGPPALLIPSLINPPHILDLDAEVSLTAAISGMERRVLLLDWGNADQRADLTIAGHVEQLLLPLLSQIAEPAFLIGYCLGGTMAIAAANRAPVEAVATIAAPWHFSRYPAEARASLQQLWHNAWPTSHALGLLPMEVLQASFWSLDPRRTVAKYAELAMLDPDGPEFRRFVALEDWANEGDPLPLPAARELLEGFFGSCDPGAGRWTVDGRAVTAEIDCPALHFTASRDRITPAESAPDGERIDVPAGHVGMVVGRSRLLLHERLRSFLAACR